MENCVIGAVRPDAYNEKRVATLQRQMAITTEKQEELGQTQPSFEGMFEHTINILSNPCDIWKNNDFQSKRMVLKVVFAERLSYCRKTGLRTAKTTYPFKALTDPEGVFGKMVRAVGVEPTRAYAQQILSLVCLPFHHARIRRWSSIFRFTPCRA